MDKHIHIHVGKTKDNAADKAKIAQLITAAKSLQQNIRSTTVNKFAQKELTSAARTMDSIISDLEEAKGVA